MLSSAKIFKTKPAKWLLSVTIFFSVFSFSGYAAQSQAQQSALKQTELVVNLSSKTAKPSISYKRALAAGFSLLHSKAFNEKSILHFNRLTKIKFDHLSKQGYALLSAVNYFQNKTIPQSQDDDFPVSRIG